MKLGIISDSHDHDENVKKAVALFKEQGVEHILHAGDLISPPMLHLLKDIPTTYIYGNNEGEFHMIEKIGRDLGITLAGYFAELSFDKLSIAMYHGTIPKLTEALVQKEEYDVVITGHTHVVVQEQVGNTLHLNPGTSHGFGKEATVMILDTKTKEVSIHTL